jgi:hypothetical protein
MVSGENGLFVWVYSVVRLRLDFGIQYSMVSGENGLFVWVYSVMGIMLVLLCLMPLSTIFQLHRGVNLIGGRKPPTCRKSLVNFITQCFIEYISPL